MDYKHRLLLSGAIATAMLAGAAQAQDARGNQIEELVVTAEKREQSLQDVPVAVSAFSDERREVVGINSVQDLTNFSPGLSYSTNNDRIALRGIGRFTNNRSTEGGVAMYSDGFYTSSVTSFARSTLFIERTEVLRGPQGTLYGRNSMGGALNIITRRPTDDFEGEVRATFQNFDYQTYEATLSGPLLEWGNIRGRVSGSYSSQDEGYFTNLSGGPDEGGKGVEWQVEYQLDGETDDGKFEWWFKGNTAEWHNAGRGPGGRTGRTIGVRENGLLFSTGLTPNSNFNFTDPLPGNDCSRCFSTNDANFISLENVSFTLNTVLHLEGFDVKYTGGHNYYDYRLQTDLDGTARTTNFLVTPTTPNVLPATATNPLGLGTTNIPPQGIFVSPRQNNQYHEEVWWFSNELNFASTTDGPAQWLFGMYQYREGSNYQLTDARYPDDPRFETPFNPLTQTPVAPNPLRNYAIGASENVNESYAAYGQIDYKLTEAWKLTAGLRYTLDKKQSFESARLFCFISPSPACIGRNTGRVFDVTNLAIPAVPVALQDRSVVVPLFTDPTTGQRHRLLEQEWDAVTGTVGLDWKPDSDTLAYVKFTRGYKAGGFNSGTTTLQQRVTTKEEKVDAYEVGLKKTFGGTFQANASAFYYKYGDIQVPLAGFNEVLQANTTEFFNLDEAIIKGFELETTWQPIDGLQILANYSYLDAQVEEGCCFQDPDDPLAIQPGANRAPIQPSLTSINQDLKGATLPSSTPHRVTVNANYTWRFDPGRLTGSVTYVWRDDTYYSLFNRYYNKAKAFETVDARAIYVDSDDRFTVIGYVKNIFDTEGLAGAGGNRLNQPFPATQGRINQTLNLIAPRTYGLELQYRF